MNDDMAEVTVFKTWDEPIADMAMGLLEAEGINGIKLAGPRSVYPVSFDGLGQIEVRVLEEDAERASEILSARFSGNGLNP